jgi:MYXO-CTERM domain-containing protein
MSFPRLASIDLLSIRGATAAAPPAELYAVEASKFEVGKISALKPNGGELGLSPGTRIPSAFLASPTTDHLGSPAPSDVPLPAPKSPANVVPGSGGPSFVPIVALLALLALVAPAALRRFGRAPDFRAPAPFVCALERPG